jgi:hypothetical protein
MGTNLASIITLVRERAGIEQNNVIPDASLVNWVNNSLAGMYGQIARTYNDYNVNVCRQVLSSAPLPNSPGNQLFLPADFFKLRRLEYRPNVGIVDDDQWYTVMPMQLPLKNRFDNPLTTILAPWGKISLNYRILGNFILIEPLDNCNGEYQMYYTPKWANLVNMTDVLPITLDTNAWVEYAVVDCCVKIMNKLRQDPQGFMAEKAEFKERIMSECQNRDSAMARSVANVRGNGMYGEGLYSDGFGGME